MTTPMSMSELLERFESLKGVYDQNPAKNDLGALGQLGRMSLRLLAETADVVEQGHARFGAQIKTYIVFKTRKGLGQPIRTSRPVRQDLLIRDEGRFAKVWMALIKNIDTKERRLVFDETNQAIYTATQSFSCAIDLLQPGSRKIPGTHFEVLIGTVLGAVTGLKRGKQLAIPGEKFKVPTDIVLERSMGDPGPILVVPTKITTRERVVQPFAHQRILEGIKPGGYRSVMVMVSEIQRADSSTGGLNEICIPNQVGMFQKYLAQLSGFYYLDPPYSYVKADFTVTLPVKELSKLLSEDLPRLLAI